MVGLFPSFNFMTKYKIQRVEFVDKLIKNKRWIAYLSVVEGNAYATLHDCTGLTDEEAKGDYDKNKGWLHGNFCREHYRQVESMLEASRKKSKIILN